MNETGYEKHTLKNLAQELDEIEDYSREFIKSKNKLGQSKEFDKSLYYDVYALAERFIEFHKENKWKILKGKIDEYTISNIYWISSEANKQSSILGKEKNSYSNYEVFRPQEGFYTICRDYCISLAEIGLIGSELEKRFLINSKKMDISEKDPNLIIMILERIANKAADKIKLL